MNEKLHPSCSAGRRAVGFFLASPPHAQITTTVDEHGKRVFVNADSPKPRHGSTISLPTSCFACGAGFSAFNLPEVPEMQASSSTNETLGGTDGKLDRIVRDAAARHNMDPALVKAVISTESGWNPQAVSSKGAVGLMQLIPGTAQRFGVGNPFDPAQNVEGGTIVPEIAAGSLRQRLAAKPSRPTTPARAP